MNKLDIKYERTQFSIRLNQALKLRGHENKILYDLKIMFRVAKSHISELRNGNALPSIYTGKRISDELNISFEWLMTGVGTAIGFQITHPDEVALLSRYRNLTVRGRKELVKASFNEPCNINELNPVTKTNRLDEKQALLKLVVKD